MFLLAEVSKSKCAVDSTHRVQRGQRENKSPLDSPCSVTCFLLLLGRARPQGQHGGLWHAGRSTLTAPAFLGAPRGQENGLPFPPR